MIKFLVLNSLSELCMCTNVVIILFQVNNNKKKSIFEEKYSAYD